MTKMIKLVNFVKKQHKKDNYSILKTIFLLN